MPYNANVPQPGQSLDADVVRNNCNALKALIDAPLDLTGHNVSELINDAGYLTQETEPVFLAAEAALFVPGDKAKLDNALTTPPALAQVLVASNNAGGNSLSNLAALNFTGSLIISTVSGNMRLDSNVPLIIKAAHGPEVTFGADGLAYTPANPGHWLSPPPASLAEAIDRLAALASNNGATPIG